MVKLRPPTRHVATRPDLLTVTCWKWGRKYDPSYVHKLAAGVARHYRRPHVFLCVTDDPTGLNVDTVPILDMNLTKVDDGCYCRLRAFDPAWQKQIGASAIVWLDLDLICVGDLAPLFDRLEPLVLLSCSHFNPCPVNGSIVKIEAGARPDIWRDFTVDEALKLSRADGRWLGSDQTWLAAKAPDAALFTHKEGVFAFGKPGWPVGTMDLPADARIVAFPGSRDPAHFAHLKWVRENWRA